ncbi:MAG TPA: septum formation initiator family protein [Spirochaetia bacterium]|nr:septum formation initiator family protein [Spirochaetaceae bacterium]HPE89831.1 septum formation initiator family protein [Spirochaetales bacterium]HRW22825.1 septum formation initiator family protein [Spirochaetia bacterium]
MKRILMIACWIAVASYCAVSAVWGPSGLVATRRATETAAAMRGNIDELARRNERYAAELESLRVAPEATALEARSLGYLASDEVAVRLDLETEPTAPAEAGRLLEYEGASAIAEARIKDIAAAAGMAVLLAGLALKAAGSARTGRKRGGQRDILVQEASRT